MQFLKKIGKVGGAANKDYRFAIGIDEGPSTKTQGSGLPKSKQAFRSCVASGVVDDLSEDFPMTSSGTQWSGFTDRIMGGCSMGTLSRERFKGKDANVLRGRVCLANNGGFIQMATNLAVHQGDSTAVDGSQYDGIELLVHCESTEGQDQENFHVQ